MSFKMLTCEIHFIMLLSIFTNLCSGHRYYCNTTLCENASDIHIGCNNFEYNISSNCGNHYRILPMTSRRKQLILHLHNRARNKIAQGLIDGYAPAERMSVLHWDNELAYLAGLNTKTCSMKHDRCRNTHNFHNVGQNIGVRITFPVFQTHARTLRHIITEWFKEHMSANQTFIDSYADHPQGAKIGHFTAMVSDRTIALGCSSILYVDSGRKAKVFLLTCNYSCTNFYGQPVYKKGPSKTACKSGSSPRYSGLCTYKEKILSAPDYIPPKIVYID